MTNEVIAINLKSVVASVRGRQFKIEEDTLEDIGRLVAELDRAVWAEHRVIGSTATTDWVALQGELGSLLEPTFLRILRSPLDGKPVTPAYVADLTMGECQRLLELQLEVDGLDDAEFAGKCLAVHRAVAAYRKIPRPVRAWRWIANRLKRMVGGR